MLSIPLSKRCIEVTLRFRKILESICSTLSVPPTLDSSKLLHPSHLPALPEPIFLLNPGVFFTPPPPFSILQVLATMTSEKFPLIPNSRPVTSWDASIFHTSSQHLAQLYLLLTRQVWWVEWWPQKRYVHVLIPRICECGLIWNNCLCRPKVRRISRWTHPGIVAVQSPSCDFASPWTAAFQASLSLIISLSLPKFTSITSVMPSSHLILWCPLLLLPSIFPSIRDFSNQSAVYMR